MDLISWESLTMCDKMILWRFSSTMSPVSVSTSKGIFRYVVLFSWGKLLRNSLRRV